MTPLVDDSLYGLYVKAEDEKWFRNSQNTAKYFVFWALTADHVLFFDCIVGSSQINNQVWVVRKAVDAKLWPGLFESRLKLTQG